MKSFLHPAGFAAFVLICLALVSWRAEQVFAHSWYPARCCSGGDCIPVPESAVTSTPGGFNVIWSDPIWGSVNEFVDRKQAEPSQDTQYHICLKPPTAKNRIRCFFAPLAS